MKNFFDNYKIYSGGNEAAPIYHEWSAFSVLSSVVSRKIWWDSGTFTHYCNLYIILVGAPGNGKSTAMKIARKFVRDLGNIPISPPSITKEAMTLMMGDKNGDCQDSFTWEDEPFEFSHLSIFANEIVTLVNTGGNAQGMVEFFTDVWDEDKYEYRTKGSGTDYIIGPYLTLLGCMTPDQTSQMLKENIISGGFSRRCLFVLTRNRGLPVSIPVITPEQEEARQACLEWCRELASRIGKFTMSEDAFEFYDAWYNKNYEIIHSQSSAVMTGYYRTKDCLIIKCAMLYALGTDLEMARGLKPLILEREHFEFVLAMFARVEPEIPKVFEGFGRNVLADLSSKILQFVNDRGTRVAKKQVQAAMWEHADRDEIDKAVFHLLDTGQLKEELVDSHGVLVTFLAVPPK